MIKKIIRLHNIFANHGILRFETVFLLDKLIKNIRFHNLFANYGIPSLEFFRVQKWIPPDPKYQPDPEYSPDPEYPAEPKH